MNTMLIMTTPVTPIERYEFKLLAGMAKDVGYQLRVAERKSPITGPSLVDYNHINERHKADVDHALENGTVYVVNGSANMINRGAIELSTQKASPVEVFAKITGKFLSRENKIIIALLGDIENRNSKLRELGASRHEIMSAFAKVAAITQ